MCRLLALIAEKSSDLSYWFFDAEKPFSKYAKKHGDGFGIGWYEKSLPKIYKEGKDEVGNYNFGKVREVKSKIILSHLRKATKGRKNSLNSHPFSYDEKWLFEHNGTVDRDIQLENLDERHKKLIKGETDSEAWFMLIMQFYEESGNIVSAIKKSLEVIKKRDYTGLKFILSDGEKIYAFRGANPKRRRKLSYYSFYYLENDGKEIAICSEKLTDDEWREIKLGELVIFDSKLNIDKVRLEDEKEYE